MKHISRNTVFVFLYIFAFALVSFVLASALGIFELPDGFYYFILGRLLITGSWWGGIMPFNNTIPQTLYGPLYGLVTAPIVLFVPAPWTMTVFTFFQLMLVAISSLMILAVSDIFFKKYWKMAPFALFLLMPFLFVYATSHMSEVFTLFLFTLYTYVSVVFLCRKTVFPSSVIFLIACLLTLTKNAFVFLLPVSVCIMVYVHFTQRKKLPRAHLGINIIPIAVGIFLLFLWARFNYIHHGIWAFTNYTGRHLYNNVVHEGKLLPDKNSGIYKTFLQAVSHEENLFAIEYEVQKGFMKDFWEGRITEQQMDKLFLEFSLGAIKNNPLSWIMHIFNVAQANLTTAPYHKGIITSLGFDDPQCPECTSFVCRSHWNWEALCWPMIENSTINAIWVKFILLQRTFYPTGATVFALLALLGTIAAVSKKRSSYGIIPVLFWLFLFVQSAAQQVEGRYVIPLYAPYALLVVFGIQSICNGAIFLLRLTRKKNT